MWGLLVSYSDGGKGDTRRPRAISYQMEALNWKLWKVKKEEKEGVLAEIESLKAKEKGDT